MNQSFDKKSKVKSKQTGKYRFRTIPTTFKCIVLSVMTLFVAHKERAFHKATWEVSVKFNAVSFVKPASSSVVVTTMTLSVTQLGITRFNLTTIASIVTTAFRVIVASITHTVTNQSRLLNITQWIGNIKFQTITAIKLTLICIQRRPV
jgi:hypothetical protein